MGILEKMGFHKSEAMSKMQQSGRESNDKPETEAQKAMKFEAKLHAENDEFKNRYEAILKELAKKGEATPERVEKEGAGYVYPAIYKLEDREKVYQQVKTEFTEQAKAAWKTDYETGP